MPPTSHRSRRRPLLTPNEQRAEGALKQIGEHHGFSIYSQVKFSHAIRDLPPGLTNEQWNYATRATFDFVVCDAETLIPEFAVELDDRTHERPDVQRRDHMKDAVCESAEFELLRIEAQHLAPGPRGRRLLEYLIDARAHCLNINELQQQGYLPDDEIFDYQTAGAPTVEEGFLAFVNDLAGPARRSAWIANERGQLDDGWIQTLSLDWRSGWSEGWAWVRARGDMLLFASTRVRSYPMFFCGITPGDLAQDLSVATIGDQLAAFDRDEPVLVKAADIGEKFAQLRARRDELVYSDFLDHTTWDGR